MNIIDKKKMAEGLLYNFHFPHNHGNDVVDFAVEVKDLARKYGFHICANEYGQIEIRNYDNIEKARASFI